MKIRIIVLLSILIIALLSVVNTTNSQVINAFRISPFVNQKPVIVNEYKEIPGGIEYIDFAGRKVKIIGSICIEEIGIK